MSNKIHIFVETEGEMFTREVDTIQEMNESLAEVKSRAPSFNPIEDAEFILGRKMELKAFDGQDGERYDLAPAVKIKTSDKRLSF